MVNQLSGRQLPHVKIQTAPHYSHQSQGVVERYHQTLFAQLRTITFQLCQDCTIDPQQISSHNPLINHLLHVHHTAWLFNRYQRHSDEKTSYGRNWQQPYNQPIIAFGGKVYVDKMMPERNCTEETKNKNTKQYGLDETHRRANTLH
eukprot:205596-Amphidinium_carterae.1